MNILKDHPFPVEAFFDRSVVLTFAVPRGELQKFIPECLELDTYNDTWAFLAVAMVQTKGLRPKGFPGFMGNDFFLIGYRIFVRFRSPEGKVYRGLYIIRSETNKHKMQFFGNIFTHYNYTTTDIRTDFLSKPHSITSQRSGIRLEFDLSNDEFSLPEGSPFRDWKAARKYAGPLPYTFTHNEGDDHVLIIQGVRKQWKPQPVEVTTYEIGYLNTLDLKGAVLASAFQVKDLPYYWKKGERVLWN